MRTLTKIFIALLILTTSCEIMPRNTMEDCRTQCKDNKKSKACYDFCECIHKDGETLDKCLDKYEKAPADSTRNNKVNQHVK